MIVFVVSFAAVQAQVSVTTYRNDLARSGANTAETILTPANVNPGRFGKLFSQPVDGHVFAQPLYMPLVTIPGKGTHNAVFVATEHGSIYAFDADSATGPNAAPLWRVNFSDPSTGETSLSVADVLGCPSISPELGITGTPVIDPATRTLYVVASTSLRGQIFHRLHALDITTGAERPGSPVSIEASVPGTGDGFSQTTVPFHSYLYKNRAGLLLLNGVVYTAWASHCDTGSYHGWLIGYNAADLHQSAIFNDSPNAFQGSLWMGGAAPAADGEGNIYVVSANGPFDADSKGLDFGDTFLKLSSHGGLSVADYFTPFNQQSLNRGDIDLGSSGPLLLPDCAGNEAHPHLLVGGGKEGRIYLLDRDRMGHYNPANDSQIVDSAPAVGPLYGGATYFNGTLFFAGANDSLKAFAISNAHLTLSPTSRSAAVFGELGASPTVSANKNHDAIVWLVAPGPNAILRAYDASNVANELYNSQMNPGRDGLGTFVKFSLPTVANGKVYVGTSDAIAVFGLLGARPEPFLAALVNAATLQPGPVAPGSLISIFGSNLTPSAAAWTPRKPAELTLSINGISCPLLFISQEQINAQLPFEIPPGPAMAMLQLPNEPPAGIAIIVAPAAPGIFTDAQNASGAFETVRPGELISLLLTGQGLVTPPAATGSTAPGIPLASAVYPISATLGNRPLEIISAGLLPGSIGVFQVSLRVPPIAPGAYPLVINVNGAPSNRLIIHVSAGEPANSAARKRN